MTLNQAIIKQITLNQSATSVTFDNIPQTGYTDLRIVYSARTDSTANPVWTEMILKPNGSATGLSTRSFFGYGSTAASNTDINGSAGFAANANSNANIFSNTEIYIPNYTSSTAKCWSVDTSIESNNGGNGNINWMGANAWTGTSAISSIVLYCNSGNLLAGSSFTLYGISKLGVTPTQTPKATGGDIIKNDGTYWYHAFLSTGSFIPQSTLSCDVLQIAGGGGGTWLGGGGAGGVSYLAAQSLTGTNYTVTVGAGGAWGTTSSNAPSGTNSQLGSLTAAIGGGGGGYFQIAGSNGGSGGGGSDWNGSTGYAGGTGSQGGNGGRGLGNSVNYTAGGGGGGAGGNGSDAAYHVGGNGGVGVNTYSSWASATGTGHSGYYASGGGGGSNNGGDTQGTASSGGGSSAGSGGGTASNATANTGGGGGGTGAVGGGHGGNGGSGIVIIRYAMA